MDKKFIISILLFLTLFFLFSCERLKQDKFSNSSKNGYIIDFNMEGITRVPIPDKNGSVSPTIVLRFDSQIASPENVYQTTICKDNDNITNLYWIDENYYSNEKYYDPAESFYLKNSDYTLKIYNYSYTLIDSTTLHLGTLYTVDTIEIKNPINYDYFNSGKNITLIWVIPGNSIPYHEGAEINLFKFDETMGDIDWVNRIKIADDYEINNFSIEDGTFTISSAEFDSPGLYVIEVALYNWSDNTSFEYQILIEIE